MKKIKILFFFLTCLYWSMYRYRLHRKSIYLASGKKSTPLTDQKLFRQFRSLIWRGFSLKDSTYARGRL